LRSPEQARGTIKVKIQDAIGLRRYAPAAIEITSAHRL